MCQNRIDAFDAYTNDNIPVSALTILNAINFTAEAWNRVKPSSVMSCWSRTGILPPRPTINIDDFLNFPTESESDNEIVQELIDRLAPDDPLSASEYISVDSDQETRDILDDDEILALVRGDEVAEDDDSQEATGPKITAAEAIESIDKLKSFLMQAEEHMDISAIFFHGLNDVRKKLHNVVMNSKSQTDISDYFY